MKITHICKKDTFFLWLHLYTMLKEHKNETVVKGKVLHKHSYFHFQDCTEIAVLISVAKYILLYFVFNQNKSNELFILSFY